MPRDVKRRPNRLKGDFRFGRLSSPGRFLKGEVCAAVAMVLGYVCYGETFTECDRQ